MLRYYILSIGFVMGFLTYEHEATPFSIQPGTRITQSTQFNQDTIFLDLTNEQADLIVVTPKTAYKECEF